MKITKRIIIGILLCVILTWSGLAAWAFAPAISEWAHCSVRVIDFVAFVLCFSGFASSCIGMNDEAHPDR